MPASNRTRDLNGYIEIKNNPLSRVGVFPYRGSNIPGAPDPTAIYMVYRPEETLSDPECIESFKLAPWIDEHTPLGDGGTPAEQVGVEGVIGEQVYYADGMLYGNLKLFSTDMEAAIAAGKRELSLGYRSQYDPTPGIYNGERYDYIQRNIRGNHIALVPEGRMGPAVAVLDEKLAFTLDAREAKVMTIKKLKKKLPAPVAAVKAKLSKLVLAMDAAEDGGEGEGDGPDMSIAEATELMKTLGPQVAELVDAVGSAGGGQEPDPEDDDDDSEMELDAATGKMVPKAKAAPADAQAKQLLAMDARMKTLEAELKRRPDEKSLYAVIAQKNKLADQLADHVGTFDASEMTLAEVAAYGIKKLQLTCDSGTELATLKGYLHGRKAPHHEAGFVLDGADNKGTGDSPVDAYLKGGK